MKRIFVVAVHFIRGVLRRPGWSITLAVCGFAALAAPRLSFEGVSLAGRVQILFSQGVGLPLILLALITVVLSTGALASDIENRRMTTLVTKPLGSLRLVLGKLLGLAAVQASILLLIAAALGLNLGWLLRSGEHDEAEQALARERVLTPRLVFSPVEDPPLPEAIRRLVERLRAGPEGGEDLPSGELETRARNLLRKFRIGPGEESRMRFEGVALPERAGNGSTDVTLHLKVQWSPPGGAPQEDLDVVHGPPEDPTRFSTRMRLPAGAPQAMALPRDIVDRSGSVILLLRNPAGKDGVTFLVDPVAVELRVAQGSLATHVLREFTALFLRLVLLGAIGLFASAAFSFPTACFTGLFIYSTGLFASFLRRTFWYEDETHARGALDWLSSVLARMGKRILDLVPDLGMLEPVGRLVDARSVSAADFAVDALWLIFVETAVIVLLAAWALSRREVGGGRT
jgi:hypothetical protein